MRREHALAAPRKRVRETSVALVFGLLAALLWGLSDFLISVIGRSFGVDRAMLYAQCVGVVLVGAWILIGLRRARALLALPDGVIAKLADGLFRKLLVGALELLQHRISGSASPSQRSSIGSRPLTPFTL